MMIDDDEKFRCNIWSTCSLHMSSFRITRRERNQVVGFTKNICQTNEYRSRDSSVGVATRLHVGRPGFDSLQGKEIFLYSTVSRSVLGPTQLPIRCVLGAISPGVKRPGREVDQSPPSSTEVKNDGAIPPLSHTSSCVVLNLLSTWKQHYLTHTYKHKTRNQ
jgi:hypothetical protein